MTIQQKKPTTYRREIYQRAIVESFIKLNPRLMVRNPVMFVVEVGSVLTTALWIQSLLGKGEAPAGFIGAITLWLWFTVLFANFPLVSMDFALMVQVVVNLLENAVKYSPENSLIEISSTLDNDKIRIKTADRGAGIPSEDLTRIFDKFYRVQRPENVSGTGLGLSISKGIIEAHRGTIYANVREGGGTIITIELPLNNKE